MSDKVNQGIQGRNVNISAHALAVGAQAQAVSMARTEDGELRACIQQLVAALGELPLKAAAHEAVKQDVAQIEAAAKGPAAGQDRWETLLKGLASKLATFGIAVKEVGSLGEPLAKIAEMVKVSAKAIGL